MAYGNQWMNMNPAMYQNMTNDQGMPIHGIMCFVKVIF